MNIVMVCFLMKCRDDRSTVGQPIHCPKCREFLGRLNSNKGFEVLCVFYDYLGS